MPAWSPTQRSRNSPNPATLRGYVWAGELWFLCNAIATVVFVRDSRHLPPNIWIYDPGGHNESPWVAYYGTAFLLRATLIGVAVFFVLVLAAHLLARFSGPFPGRGRGRGILVLVMAPMLVSAFVGGGLVPSVLAQVDRAPLSESYALSSLATSVTTLTIAFPILVGVSLGVAILLSYRMRPPRLYRPAQTELS